MTDDIDMWIFHGIDDAGCIPIPAARLDTGSMETCNRHIHLTKIGFPKIHSSILVQNVHLRP
jgi:predicted peptidase